MNNQTSVSGFKNAGMIPIINTPAPNQVLMSMDYHISYNPRSDGYGCRTTAIVLKDRVFFVLDGDHRKELSDIVQSEELQGVIDYFIANIDKANRMSEHHFIVGEKEKDIFALTPTALAVIGQENIDRISAASK